MARPRKVSMYSTYLKKRLIRMLEMRDNTIKGLELSCEQWRGKCQDLVEQLNGNRSLDLEEEVLGEDRRIEAEKEVQQLREELASEVAGNLEYRDKRMQLMTELNRLSDQAAENTRQIDDLERALAEADGYKTRVKQQDEMIGRFLEKLAAGQRYSYD